MKILGSLAVLIGSVTILSTCTDESLIQPFDIPNPNQPSLNALLDNPTPSVLQAAAQGLLEGLRQGTDDRIQTVGHYGREGYYLAVARTVLDEFDEPLLPAGGSGWATTYTFIQTSNAILNAVGAVEGMPAQDQEAVRGWAKTVEAFLLHGQIRQQDDFGIVIDTDRPRGGELAPIVSKAEAFSYIAQRYDEAAAHLSSAGSSFPFELSEGLEDFNTPASMRQVAMSLKARALAEIGDYPGVIAALNQSFLDIDGELADGAWNSYSTQTGDQTTPFFDPSGFQYLLDTMLVVDAQTQPDGSPDQRLLDKTFETSYITHTGVTSNLGNGVYPTNTSPIPLIKNEELILLRAEARMFTGNRSGAIQDLNVIRTRSGGLAPLTGDPGDPGLLDELLYNRRYSLLWEFGHRWVDMRRFNRLDQFVGPRGPGDRIFSHVPIAEDECQQRDFEPTGCQQVDGIRTTR
jgi:hypothetical protein